MLQQRDAEARRRAGHHKSKREPRARATGQREEYVNVTGHGVGARQAKLVGLDARTKYMPEVHGEPTNPDYRRPPCLDENNSYRFWLCDRERCRAENCTPWCTTERRARGL